MQRFLFPIFHFPTVSNTFEEKKNLQNVKNFKNIQKTDFFASFRHVAEKNGRRHDQNQAGPIQQKNFPLQWSRNQHSCTFTSLESL